MTDLLFEQNYWRDLLVRGIIKREESNRNLTYNLLKTDMVATPRRYNEWVTRRSSFVVSIFNNWDPRITTIFGQLTTFWRVLKGEQAVQYSSDIQIAWVQSYILNLWVFREACPSSWLAHRWRSILTTFQFSSLYFWLEKIICTVKNLDRKLHAYLSI